MILGKITLAKKISVVTVGLVLVSSTIVIAIFAVGNNKNIIHQHVSNLESRTQFLTPLILKNIDSVIKKSEMVSDILIEQIQFENSQDKVEEMLTSVVKTGQFILEISFENYKTKSTTVIYKIPTGAIRREHLNMPMQKLSEEQARFSNVHLYTRGDWNSVKPAALDFTTPVSLPNKEVIGKLKMVIDFRENIEFVRQLSTQRLRIFLANPNGEYVFNSNPEKIFALGKEKEHLVQHDYDEMGAALKSAVNKKVIPRIQNQTGMALHFTRLDFRPTGEKPNLEWIGLVQIADYWEALVESETLKRKTYLSAAILIFITLIVALIFSKLISKNLQRITDAAIQYTRGETELQLNIKSADEIGILANAFQGMIYQVNERTRRIKRSEEKAQKSKEMMEEALKANQELLENVQKQKAEIERIDKEKDDLMAVVSHDLKNPLSVIETSMSLILENNPEISPEILDLLSRSKRGAKFGLNLITDLLEIARLEGGIVLVPEIFNIKKLIHDCIQQFTLAAKDKLITLSADVAMDFEIFADYRKLSQVVNNLLSNAIKFTPPNGTITIMARMETEFLRGPFGERKILKLSVQDNGIGVPKDKLTKIFNKYEQARSKDRETGTGLGLAICKNICELHDGRIGVSSVEGQGTTFFLDLPVLVESQNVCAYDLHPEIILITDDAVETEKINALLGSLKISVKTFTADKFLKTSRLSLENPIVLADVTRPEIHHLMFNLRQQKDWEDVPIFILASKFGRDLLDKFAGLADGTIEWPCSEIKFTFALKDFIPNLNWKKLEEIHSAKSTHPELVEVSQGKIIAIPAAQLTKILIVDDSEDTHQLIRIMLKGQPVHLIHAHDGKEGVALFAKHLPGIILMDLNMPGIDGLKASKIIRQWELKKDLARAKILAITASDDGRTRENCLLAGMDGAFNKPFSKNDVLDLIREPATELSDLKKVA